MSVELVDDKSNLKFQLHLSACSRWEYRTHAKGHYEIECIDSGENFPRIQRCNLTLLEMIEVGGFIDMLEMNKTLSADHQLKSGKW
jgi:hypothetical protein